MIEFCTKKRMLIIIITLVSISLVILFLEGRWSTLHKLKEIQKAAKRESNNETCRSGKESVDQSCSECSNDELEHEAAYCQKTGFREVIHCEDGTKVHRGCPMTPWMEERKFLMFEAATMVIGLLSYGLVVVRQRKLDHMLREKIDRQIAAGI